MPPKKRVLAVVKIQLPAGGATPAPPVGTALGPHGVQTMEFCKQYNAATESQRGSIIPVDITIYEDRTFSFILKTPPTPALLRQAAGLEKGAAITGREQVGTVTDTQIAEIAAIKLPDLNTNDVDAAKRQVAGTARSMGIAVTGYAHRLHKIEETENPTVSRGKKYKASIAQFDREELYSAIEAVDLVKATAKASFDETVEVAVRLGVDPRKADQIVRGTLSLPAGTGRTARVVVFAAGEKAADARKAGADVVGADDLVTRVKEGFLDFDIAIATPDLMGQVGTLGRVLGPRGLMPNPKTGTVTDDVEKAVIEFKGGRVEYRTDKVGNIHLRIGKASFESAQLLENLHAVMDELNRAKPASAKGRYIRAVTISSTMGPGISIDPLRARRTEDELAASA
jgi:large subunit ribosomal protein L1